MQKNKMITIGKWSFIFDINDISEYVFDFSSMFRKPISPIDMRGRFMFWKFRLSVIRFDKNFKGKWKMSDYNNKP